MEQSLKRRRLNHPPIHTLVFLSIHVIADMDTYEVLEIVENYAVALFVAKDLKVNTPIGILYRESDFEINVGI